MYTRLSAPRTPVSFFREIRLMSYFDSNIILTFTHTAPEKQSTYTRYRYPPCYPLTERALWSGVW